MDSPEIVTGTTAFGIDAFVPNALVASIVKCPFFGGRLGKLDARAARALPGIVDVWPVDAIASPVCVSPGVAVLAHSTYAALRARKTLAIAWERPRGVPESTQSLRRRLRQATANPRYEVLGAGSSHGRTSSDRKVLREYATDLLAQAPMEPMNALARTTALDCELWIPTQDPGLTRRLVAATLQLDLQRVRVNVMRMGGAFGRRTYVDFAVEAALLSRRAGAPVKVMWTREDDFSWSFYHPPSHHVLEAGLDSRGAIDLWSHRLATASTAHFYEGVDLAQPYSTEIGAADEIPYAPARQRLAYTHVDTLVPRGAWRSVSAHFNVFAIESFIDELATAQQRDPVEYRLALLARAAAADPDAARGTALRCARALARVAGMAGWPATDQAGRATGYATWSFASADSICAAAVQVERSDEALPRVLRVWVAIDCGLCVHPHGVRAQVEGSVVWALSAALGSDVVIEDGRAVTLNFDRYPVLRMNQMPMVEVAIMDSDATVPGGVGETAVPPIAPALANAIFALTGRRPRRLPFSSSQID